MRAVFWICLVTSAAIGCSGAPPPVLDPLDGQTVFVDTVTGKAFPGQPTEELPAIHPQTGKRTLMPGLYCAKCQAWYPSPPLEVRQREPKSLRCPKTGELMTPHGPPPENG